MYEWAAGAAFYTIKDDELSGLESGTRFGPHLLVGSKVRLSDSVFGAIDIEPPLLA